MKKQTLAAVVRRDLGNSTVATIFLSAFLFLIPQLARAQAGVVISTKNPLQVALLHWDQANQVRTEFTVGSGPLGVAFDGASVWVANNLDGTISKLAANDGTLLGKFSVTGQPWGLAFDGANIWVANNNSNNVTKLRASDGMLLGTFTVGSNPSAVAFDGANIWVANSSDVTVSKL